MGEDGVIEALCSITTELGGRMGHGPSPLPSLPCDCSGAGKSSLDSPSTTGLEVLSTPTNSIPSPSDALCERRVLTPGHGSIATCLDRERLDCHARQREIYALGGSGCWPLRLILGNDLYGMIVAAGTDSGTVTRRVIGRRR
jgi:hypothetical protein